jgi:aminoglycoside/choline kinase family phosphotransferase
VRHVRVLAVFARLIGRGREGYRAHLHRVWRLLESRLQHPELAAVRGWFDAHVPAAARPRD